MTFYIVLALSAFLISLLGTRLLILALRSRIHPLELRRAHLEQQHPPAPHGGGVAVFFALVICLLVADIHYALALALFLLAGIALLSDLIDVPRPVRLMVQAIAVALPLSMSQTPVFGGLLTPLADKVITGAIWVWGINLFIRMDKLEGITATEMITIGLGLCLLIGFSGGFPNPLFTNGMITAAAAAGFLWWSWYPAKIWLGEIGTATAGFISFYLLWQMALHGYGFAAAILPAYYLADGVISQLACWQKRRRVPGAPCEYYYMRALKSGRSADEVIRYIFGINLLLVFLAVRTAIDPEIDMIFLGVAYMTVFMLLGFFSHSLEGRRQKT